MKKLLIGLFILTCTPAASSQNWEIVGGGFDNDVRDLYADTVNNTLYAVGVFHYTGDSIIVNRLGAWKNGMWEGVGTLTNNTCHAYSPIMSITKYNNDLFIAGHFTLCPNSIKNLARWDGNNWLSCGSPNEAAINLSVINGDLFCFGGFDTISGQYIKNMAIWNGATWEQFGTIPPFNPFRPSCMAYYNGSYYFAGNFNGGNGYNEIVRWDGVQWLPLQNGIFGGNASVWDIITYNGYLFVGGEFYENNGNIANYLMAWDGQNWFNPFPNVQFTFFAQDFEIINNELYIAAWHSVAGDTNEYGLAKFDGVNFCSIGGANNFIFNIAALNDTLYAATQAFFEADSFKYIYRMPINIPPNNCVYQPLYTSENENGNNIYLHPNPASNLITISISEMPHYNGISFSIVNMIGEKMKVGNIYEKNTEIDIANLPSGAYILEIIANNTRVCKKLLKLN